MKVDIRSWIKSRFPARRDFLLAFIVCVLPVHAWTWVLFLYKIPSYLLQLSISQTLGVFSYAQVFALIESALLCVGAILLAFLLPRRLFLAYFTPQVVLLVFALSAWAIGVQLYGVDFAGSDATMAKTQSFVMGWTAGWLVVLVGLSVALHSWKVVQKWLWAFADRLIVLSGFFLLVDAISVIIVVVRNL